MTESEKNLHDFYQATGSTPLVEIVETESYSMVNGVNGTWPQMIFQLQGQLNAEEQIRQLFAGSPVSGVPDFAVCDSSDMTIESQQALKNQGIFPVMTWTLMERERDVENVESGFFLIKKLTKAGELEAFARLVNTEMLTSVKITTELLVQLARDPGVEIFGMEENKQLISALLCFTKEQTTGLYFIVTDRRKRGEGRASALIQTAIEKLSALGTTHFVLQAVNKAVPLYTKKGFKPTGKLAIFWNTKSLK